MSILLTLTEAVNFYLPQPHASLMNGILYGEQLSKNTPFYEQVHKVGLLHIVVISGTNITLLGGLIHALTLKIFGRILSLVMTLIAICAFVLLVGADPPITRAAIMGCIALLGKLSGRKTYTLYTLFLSGVVVAIFKWEWMSSVSFHLSFFATLGIILCARKPSGEVPSKTEPKSRFTAIKEYISSDLYTSLSAQIFTVPIIFWKFNEISLIAPFSNIAVSFIIGPLMVIGAFTSILGSIHPLLGKPFAYISFGLLHYMVSLIRYLSDIPYIFFAFHGE
ncbi:ComEC/Rec2 family competence protein [Candidatus Woesebacteria bacterium]|nr:ComEC/Rec2 family competence protein [Candidatus Woesebacteria bacterium]